MIRVSGYYLYNAGASIHPLNNVTHTTKLSDAFFPVLMAESTLEILLNNSVFNLKTSRNSGANLLASVREIRKAIENTDDKDKILDFYMAYRLADTLKSFEAVLGAELWLF
jgi:hypothetical protein